ncbi:hypothetical protein NIES2100_42950 [Calothrix sp. NIES-2100]|nr:hypothetical protein NIES2100_42950 [Calothrix sp. NIES-2100]
MTALNLSEVRFSNYSDVVNPGRAIYNSQYSSVDTLGGDDQIIGTSNVSGDFALVAYSGAATQYGKAIASSHLKDKATVATYGIKNEGTINTNYGNDIVRGKATANISATAVTVSEAIANAQKSDAIAIANAFASINVKATADGIDNSWGKLYTGDGSDSVTGNTDGSVSAVAVAILDASAIVEAICKAPMSQGLTAFAQAMATSLAKGSITATGLKNNNGVITTGKGDDTLSASATSSAGTFASSVSSTLASATPGNQALAQSVALASAQASDTAIAIDNSRGLIDTGIGYDTIDANAKASDKAIAINNSGGKISTGDGNDTITAKASGAESYGIFGGNIDTGYGNDRVIASSFGGGVNIDLGLGNDFVQGFGDAKLDGSLGWDTLDLSSYNKDNFKISFGGLFGFSLNNSVSFQLDGVTMTTTGFDQFNFANGSYNFAQLRWA